MANLATIWNGLTTTRKAILVGVLVATLGAFATMINFASKPQLALLYAGLEPAAAGEILTALEGMDTIAEVRGDAIYVPATKRDATRLALAQRGLPQQGQPGFELLDDMNGFATTSEMFDATYWRAKEGELARTILAIPAVKAARVHIGAPKSSSFARGRRSARASVTVTMGRGVLDANNAMAIRYLVALAVPELDAEQVVVIDSARGILLKPGTNNPALIGNGDDEADRIRRLETSLLELLEAHVGLGNARVNVALKIDRTHETISERVLDPETRVLMSRDALDSQESDVGNSGAVTVASNLPDGDADASPVQDRSQRAETRETSRYDVSAVERQRETLPGAVARINVAVLVNEKINPETGETVPRGESELKALEDLVAAAVGFDEERGDVIAVRSMVFQQDPLSEGALSEASPLGFLQDHLMLILQILIPAIVVIVLALFVIKPVLTSSTAGEPIAQLPLQVAAPSETSPAKALSPVEELRELAGSQKSVSANVLKAWLGETETVS